MSWVAIQPVLRRLFGNSFLPYHDYGRGGRGWRDLWQDCPGAAADGTGRGARSAVQQLRRRAPGRQQRHHHRQRDRANSRPTATTSRACGWITACGRYLTTQLYIDQSGDLDFLLRQQAYFKDQPRPPLPGHDTLLDTGAGHPASAPPRATVYQGTILEHLLIQHLTAFFNVGEHNNILLEGADWNDGMDMARQRGESVAFTAFYASNLRRCSAGWCWICSGSA